MPSLQAIVAEAIDLSDTLCWLASEADAFRRQCSDLNDRAHELSTLLHLAACLATSGRLYARPLLRILDEVTKTLCKAHRLLKSRCHGSSMVKCFILITSANDFKRLNALLDNSIADMAWFLTISDPVAGAKGMLHSTSRTPPIASSEPLLSFCWERIATLHRGVNQQDKEDAVMALYKFVNNEGLAEIMAREECVLPLLKVLTDGTVDAQEVAARTLGCMAKYEINVRHMVLDGIAPVLVEVLNSPLDMRVQAAIAWVIAVIVEVDPEQQSLFLEHRAVRPLVALLSEGLEDSISLLPLSQESLEPLHKREFSLVDSEMQRIIMQTHLNRRDREDTDPKLQEQLKAEVTRALWKLAKGNPQTCRSLTRTKTLLCFAILMEKATGLIQLHSVMTIMSIAAVAETNVDIRRVMSSSLAAKVVIGQLLRLINNDGNRELQVACIRAVGSLSRTFRAREGKVIESLVGQLDSPDEVCGEAVQALAKFVCKENYLRHDHSRAVIEAGGIIHLLQLIYFGKQQTQFFAVTVMCYLAINCGENEELGRAELLPVLKRCSKIGTVSHHAELPTLLHHAVSHLKFYHGRSTNDHVHTQTYHCQNWLYNVSPYLKEKSDFLHPRRQDCTLTLK